MPSPEPHSIHAFIFFDVLSLKEVKAGSLSTLFSFCRCFGVKRPPTLVSYTLGIVRMLPFLSVVLHQFQKTAGSPEEPNM